MDLTQFHFTGFNGFGQFKNLSKVITSFQGVKLERFKAPSKSFIVRGSWNYCAIANDCELCMTGCLNGQTNQEYHLPFEYPIKDVACAESFCLVLLNTGLAYKIDCHTFEINEINSLILQRCASTNIDDDDVEDGCCGGGKIKLGNFSSVNFSAQQQNQFNENRDEFITHIATGRSLTVILTNKNNLYNMPLKIYSFPVHVKIKKISCGNEHCLILTRNGDLYAFGSSTRGQLGLGELESKDEPVLVEALAGIKIIDMAAGGWHSVAVSAFYDLYAWGWNVNGQIGQSLYKTYRNESKNGQTQIEKQKCPTVFATPLIVNLSKMSDDGTDDDADGSADEFSDENQYHAVSVSAGSRHTLVQVEGGLVLGAGWNKYGQLASDKLTYDFDRFHTINGTNALNNANYVCGEWSTYAIPRSKSD